MFRDVILGYKHVDSLRLVAPVPSEERVGKSETIRTVPSGDEATGTNDGANTDALKTNTDLLKGSTKRTWADVVKGRGATENKRLVS